MFLKCLARSCCVLVAVFLCSLLRAESYQWRSVAINGGGFVSGTLYHPKTQGLVYARTDVGGAYRWDNVYQRWIALNDDILMGDSQLLGVLSFAVDPEDDGYLYLACGQYLPSWAHVGAILRSHDRGRTWTQFQLNYKSGASTLTAKLGGNSDGRSAGERLQVDPNLGSILFLGTNQDGLLKSTDRGATWTKVANFTKSAVTFVAFDSTSGTPGAATPVLYAGTESLTSGSVYKSLDGGVTWAVVPGYTSGYLAYRGVVDSQGTLFVTFSDNVGPNNLTKGLVMKLTSSGLWSNITPPTGQGGFAGISLARSSPGTLVVSTLDRWSTGDVIYRSTDSGATWKLAIDRSQLDVIQAPWAKDSSPHWIGDVQVDPFDPNKALFITGYGLFSTQTLTAGDTGGTPLWAFTNRGLEETVPLAIVSPPSGPSLVSALGDIDGFQHFDLDTPASSRLKPLLGTTHSLDFGGQATTTMARMGSSNGQYSLDTGATWTAFPAHPPLSNGTGNIAVTADGSRLVWIPTKATAYVSSNLGGSWTAATGLPSTASADWTPVTDRVNKNKVYVHDKATGKLYRSIDGGFTFAAGYAGFPINYSAQVRAVPDHEDHLWAAVWNSGLLRSTDGGVSFSRVSNVDDAYRINFGKAALGQSYPAVFLFGKVSGLDGFYRSDDNGVTWTLLNDPSHQFGWINDLAGDPRVYGRLYLATGGRGIVYGDFAPPMITRHPASASVEQGFDTNFSLSVDATGDGLTYQWYRGGAVIPGATEATYTMATAEYGDYYVVVSGYGGAVTSRFARITLEIPGQVKLSNLSIRGVAGHNSQPLILGFVPKGSRNVLLRVAGPVLAGAPFNVSGTLPDPVLSLHVDSGGFDALEAINDNWGDGDLAASLADVFARVGAFAFSDTKGKDAALQAFVTGPRTAHANSSVPGVSGVVLVEGYDTDVNFDNPLVNLSARNYCGTGADILIAGFVITGHSPMRVLVRGVGPGLGQFGVTGFLEDPVLELHGMVNDAPVVIASNDNWGAEPLAAEASTASGAFTLPNGSSDAALILTLPPGAYTAHVYGANGTTGEGLVEVYQRP